MFGEAGVSVQHHTCHVCGHVLQQDPHHLTQHLSSHGHSLSSYTDQYMSQDTEVISSISSTSKSSPILGDCSVSIRKSTDNLSEPESNQSEQQQQPQQQQQQIRGVALVEPGDGSIDEGDDDNDSSIEELMEMPEPQVEIQEGEYTTNNFAATGDIDVNIIESIAENNREFMENAMRYFQQQQQQQQHVQTLGSEMFRSSDWADKCVYQCRICQPHLMFDTHSKMSYHVKKRHDMAMKDYTTNYGRAMIHEEKHCCQICGSHVLWERSSIYQHVYQVNNNN